MPTDVPADPESARLIEDDRKQKNWKRWGPYLSARQWGTVREDYSAEGDAWEYFPHDHARSRAHRWGEDGLLGVTDRECRLCFAPALWNGHDPILKERFFGLTNAEGNHGEDVKEEFFHLDATPTHSYLKALYKYPQGEFPYQRLLDASASRTRLDPEFELVDTGIFAGNRYWDVTVEYAKADPDDLLVRFAVANRGPAAAVLDLLPTVWFRNTWAWGSGSDEGRWPKPRLSASSGGVRAEHATLGPYVLAADGTPDWWFTENESDRRRLFGAPNTTPYVKDAFHSALVGGKPDAVNPAKAGTKAAAVYRLNVPAGGTATVRLRLRPAGRTGEPFGPAFDATVATRVAEADAFYAARLGAADGEARVARQAYSGLLWTKQFYHYVVKEWLDGDPASPPPPKERLSGRNSDWRHLFNRDVLLVPDGWEYPWYAAWDLAFHCVAVAAVDAGLAKDQLVRLLREWYTSPAGQLPAYEWNFGDVNPPVHAWACWRVYKITAPRGGRDRAFLEACFHKLLIAFTWWVNRKDPEGRNLFGGGFLGLDNIGPFDRSRPLPEGTALEQADGTAWAAFFCLTMLGIALELSAESLSYEGVASKFFDHFVAIADAANAVGGAGLWDAADGFYYDRLESGGEQVWTRVRSLVGLVPLIAVEVLDEEKLARLPGFVKRMNWFLAHRPDLAEKVAVLDDRGKGLRLLALPSRARLTRVLGYLLDEAEFLSPHGVRSVSKYHKDHPYVATFGGREVRVDYEPGESTTGLFGGNSNWRGPVWFPVNYLLVEALERYHHFYGAGFTVECPTGSGRRMTLGEVSREIAARLVGLFRSAPGAAPPWAGGDARYATDPGWRGLPLFHEYFHGETGRGLGASHQTGWTALVARLIADRNRPGRGA